MPELNIEFFTAESFKENNKSLIEGFEKQDTEFESISKIIDEFAKRVNEFKRDFGILTDEDYEGFFGFFKKIGKNYKDFKTKINEIKDKVKKYRVAIIISLLGLAGLIAYLFLA